MPADEEEALVRAAAGGDSAAFERIYQRYARPLYAYALGRLGDHGEAEDLVQDAFLALARLGAGFRARPSLAAFLFRVVRNRVLSRHRDRRPGVELPDLAGPAPAPEQAMALNEALAALPGEQREALLLALVHGLSYDEIAATMGTALGTVRSRIARARLRLHAVLGPGGSQ